MLNQITLDQLRALKLLAFAEGLQQQMCQPDTLAMSFEERLALLVDRELAARSDRKRVRLLQRANLKYPDAAIENAEFTGIRGMDRRTLTSLALSGWIERGDTLLISGATGVGKSWLACALAQYACRHGHSALYLRVPRLVLSLALFDRGSCTVICDGRSVIARIGSPGEGMRSGGSTRGKRIRPAGSAGRTKRVRTVGRRRG
jgi:DNA replication protein DnaC